MNYQLLYDNPEESLTTRLLKIRKIDDQLSDFLAPTYRRYRQAPANLSDIDKARQRIVDAIQRNEKIMIFGDYDVDGIVSS
jgi:single-stranded-DNA-specific exonuclease